MFSSSYVVFSDVRIKLKLNAGLYILIGLGFGNFYNSWTAILA